MDADTQDVRRALDEVGTKLVMMSASLEDVRDAQAMETMGYQTMLGTQQTMNATIATLSTAIAVSNERSRVLTWLAVVPALTMVLIGALVVTKQVIVLLQTIGFQPYHAALAFTGLVP
jgi:hypothetical protein